jgi:LmbE family N-acetylglucosaminyl deacetylase
MKRVLIIAAHPDDDILGCGGIISKYGSIGVEFRVIFIAEGTSCRYPAEHPEILAEVASRTKYGIRALSVLGQKNYHFYDLPCGQLHLVPQLTINKIIENEIEAFNPDTIFTHSYNDTNNDHRTVFECTLTATRPILGRMVSKLYSYEILSSSEWRYDRNFEPNFFVALSNEDMMLKFKAMQEYTTESQEFPHPRSQEGIYALAQVRGMQMNSVYAEAFRLIREFNK